jgi:hypothetical protein
VRSVVQLCPGPFVGNVRPAATSVVAGRFRLNLRRIPCNVPSNNPQLLEPIAHPLEVPRDAVLNNLGAVPVPRLGARRPYLLWPLIRGPARGPR